MTRLFQYVTVTVNSATGLYYRRYLPHFTPAPTALGDTDDGCFCHALHFVTAVCISLTSNYCHADAAMLTRSY